MWTEYFLFLLKFATVVILLGGLGVTLALVARQAKQSDGVELDVLNEKRNLNQSLFRQLAWSKEEKKAYKQLKKTKENEKKQRSFVLSFTGDIKASDAEQLKLAIDAVIDNANSGDECIIKLESAGGMVPHYGLATMELARLRHANIPLTAVVDKVAASGGYMMAAVADKIIANPFAILGSIGVVAGIPNFNKVLKNWDIDFEQHTAGTEKRNLTLFGENTDKDREHFKEELEKTHAFFKKHIAHYRPKLAIESVATGAHYYGTEALEKGLIDEIGNSSSLIDDLLKTHQVIEVKTDKNKGLKGVLGKWFKMLTTF